MFGLLMEKVILKISSTMDIKQLSALTDVLEMIKIIADDGAHFANVVVQLQLIATV